MAKNLPNLMKYMNLYIQEAQHSLSKINLKKRTMLRCITIKPSKAKAKVRIFQNESRVTCHIQRILKKINSYFLIITNNNNQKKRERKFIAIRLVL